MKAHTLFVKQFSFFAPLCVSAVLLASCSGNNQEEQQTAQQTPPPPQEEPAEEMQQPDTSQLAEAKPEEPAPTTTKQTPVAPPMKAPLYKASNIVSYKDLDANNNGVLSKTEFYNGFFKVWDEDGNSTIDENEFTTAANQFFNKNDYSNYGGFSQWDANGDSQLDSQEFRQGMNAVTGDKSNGERLVTAWDLDDDDKIERVELDNITVRLDKDDN